MYQQIPPPPYQPSSYQPPCRRIPISSLIPPMEIRLELSRPIGAAFVLGCRTHCPRNIFPWYLYRYLFIRVQHGSVGDFR